MSTTRTVTLVRRWDGLRAGSFDVTGYSVRDFERMWDGLVRQVDFEIWQPEYEPDRGEEQTVEGSLAGESS